MRWRLIGRRPRISWREHAPNDPELLLGAGLISDDKDRAPELLRQAAEKSNSATAWSAYRARLMTELPSYMSRAECGGDPANPKFAADSLKLLQESEAKGVPDHLQPDEIAPAMQALKKWEAADSQNAAPVALEVQLLSAVGHDDEALSRWEAAARRPKVDLHLFETYSGPGAAVDAHGDAGAGGDLDHGNGQLSGEPDYGREAPASRPRRRI